MAWWVRNINFNCVIVGDAQIVVCFIAGICRGRPPCLPFSLHSLHPSDWEGRATTGGCPYSQMRDGIDGKKMMLIRILRVVFFVGTVCLLTIPIFSKSINSVLITNIGFKPTQIIGEQFPLLLMDPVGRQHELRQPPKRIVSSTLATDEILQALVPFESIVAVTDLVDDEGISNVPHLYPAHIKRMSPEIEEILALEPDLIFTASFIDAATVTQLIAVGIPTARITRFHSFDDTRNNILTVAKLVGAETAGKHLIATFNSEIEYIVQRVTPLAKPRVLYWSPSGYTAGTGSSLDECITLAGGFNVIAETDITTYAKISEEFAMGLEPDIIIMSGWTPENDGSPAQTLLKNPLWQEIAAVKNKRVYDIHGAWITSGSHFQARGVWALAKLFHPEVVDRDISI